LTQSIVLSKYAKGSSSLLRTEQAIPSEGVSRVTFLLKYILFFVGDALCASLKEQDSASFCSKPRLATIFLGRNRRGFCIPKKAKYASTKALFQQVRSDVDACGHDVRA
jgi:hypothetical protein